MYARELSPLALGGRQAWHRSVQSIHPVQCEYVQQQLHAALTLPARRLNREKVHGRGYQRLCSLIAGNLRLLSTWCTVAVHSQPTPHLLKSRTSKGLFSCA